jgi:hypothetical protein
MIDKDKYILFGKSQIITVEDLLEILSGLNLEATVCFNGGGEAGIRDVEVTDYEYKSDEKKLILF